MEVAEFKDNAFGGTMGNMKEKTRCNVISVRASDEEWAALAQMVEERTEANGAWRKADAGSDDVDIWIRVTPNAKADPADALIDPLATISALGERKRLHEDIEITHTNLSSRACELELANNEMEAFCDAVSHDLRLPMTIISGYCQLILENPGENLGEQCREYLLQIHGETTRANELIDTLLRFSRINHTDMSFEIVDLSQMGKDIVAGLMSAQPQRRVQYVSAEGVTARGDTNFLRVAMSNLLGNAWKYTATREEALIEFGTTEVNGKSAYFIRDNGVGFDMAEAHRLFTPFQRLHTRKEFEGNGIGLSIVRKIVHRHGGEIWAEGNVGQGATFHFTLE